MQTTIYPNGETLTTYRAERYGVAIDVQLWSQRVNVRLSGAQREATEGEKSALLAGWVALAKAGWTATQDADSARAFLDQTKGMGVLWLKRERPIVEESSHG